MEAGHQVRVFTLWDDEPGARPDWLFGLSRRTPLALRMGLIFLRLIRHAGWADLVYINGLEAPAVAAARLVGKPILLKIVGDYAWERARLNGRTRLMIEPFQRAGLPFSLAWQRRLLHRYTSQADLVITPSQYLKGLVTGWGVAPDRVRVILNGLTPLPPPQAAAEAAGPDGQATIVTASRLVDWKGVDHLIEALSLMERPARLLVLGQGPELFRLQDLASRLDLAGRVEFRGRVGRSEVLETIRRADIFALASGYEGLPHVVLEAMACGRPVVAAQAGGTPEAVRHEREGLLVPFGNPSALAAAFDKLLADPDLAGRLGRAGEARAAEFPWSKTVAENRRLIEEMIP